MFSQSSGDGGDSPLLLEKLTDDDLKNVVYKNWQEIQKECKRLDPNSTGIITSDKFVGEITLLSPYNREFNEII